MRWRLTSIFLLAFQFLWLNIVLPGHTRGIVQMPGSQAEEDACCAAPAADEQQPDGRQERAANCAVCFFAARMTTAGSVDLRPPALELIGKVDEVQFHSHARRHLSAYHSRGPPPA